MNWWTVLWVAWILAFFAVEIPAIRNARRNDTLSEHFQAWFHVRTTWGKWTWIIAWGVFSAWFVPHILGVSFS